MISFASRYGGVHEMGLFSRKIPASDGLNLVAMGIVPSVIDFWGADRDGELAAAYLAAYVSRRADAFGVAARIQDPPLNVFKALCLADHFFHQRMMAFVFTFEEAKRLIEADPALALEAFYDRQKELGELHIERRSFVSAMTKFTLSIDEVILRKSADWKRGQ